MKWHKTLTILFFAHPIHTGCVRVNIFHMALLSAYIHSYGKCVLAQRCMYDDALVVRANISQELFDHCVVCC